MRQPQFILAVCIAKKTRTKLDRLLYSIQRRRPPPQVQALCRMVWGRGAMIAESIERLMDERCWDAVVASFTNTVATSTSPTAPQAPPPPAQSGMQVQQALQALPLPETEPEAAGITEQGSVAAGPGGARSGGETENPNLRQSTARRADDNLAGGVENATATTTTRGRDRRTPQQLETRLLFHIQRLLRRMSANYDKRIMYRLRSDPARLFWLGAGQAEWQIDQRAELCATLLSEYRRLDHEQQSPGGRAMVRRFPATLQECANNGGRISRPLWIMWRIIGELARCDTQELESLMNSIKMIVASCPRIEKQSLDSRLGIMKKFRELTGGLQRRQMRWKRDAAPAVMSIVNEALDHNPKAVLDRFDRFETPAAILRHVPVLKCLEKGNQTELETSTLQAMRWASRWNSAWMAAYQKSLDNSGGLQDHRELEILAILDRQLDPDQLRPSMATGDQTAVAKLADENAETGRGGQQLQLAVWPGPGAAVPVTGQGAQCAVTVRSSWALGQEWKVRSTWVLGMVFDRSGHFYQASLETNQQDVPRVIIHEPRRPVSSLEIMATMHEGRAQTRRRRT